MQDSLFKTQGEYMPLKSHSGQVALNEWQPSLWGILTTWVGVSKWLTPSCYPSPWCPALKGPLCREPYWGQSRSLGCQEMGVAVAGNDHWAEARRRSQVGPWAQEAVGRWQGIYSLEAAWGRTACDLRLQALGCILLSYVALLTKHKFREFQDDDHRALNAKYAPFWVCDLCGCPIGHHEVNPGWNLVYYSVSNFIKRFIEEGGSKEPNRRVKGIMGSAYLARLRGSEVDVQRTKGVRSVMDSRVSSFFTKMWVKQSSPLCSDLVWSQTHFRRNC